MRFSHPLNGTPTRRCTEAPTSLTASISESQAAAVDRIEEIQKSEKIDCDFRRLDGYLFQGREMPADIIDKETTIIAAALGVRWRLCHVPILQSRQSS